MTKTLIVEICISVIHRRKNILHIFIQYTLFIVNIYEMFFKAIQILNYVLHTAIY